MRFAYRLYGTHRESFALPPLSIELSKILNDLPVNYSGSSDFTLSADLVTIFQGGEYEDGIAGNSGWATGDWNGDKEFNTTDLVVAFQDGGFELGPRADALASVPEPNSVVLLLIGTMGLLRFRRRS